MIEYAQMQNKLETIGNYITEMLVLSLFLLIVGSCKPTESLFEEVFPILSTVRNLIQLNGRITVVIVILFLF